MHMRYKKAIFATIFAKKIILDVFFTFIHFLKLYWPFEVPSTKTLNNKRHTSLKQDFFKTLYTIL